MKRRERSTVDEMVRELAHDRTSVAGELGTASPAVAAGARRGDTAGRARRAGPTGLAGANAASRAHMLLRAACRGHAGDNLLVPLLTGGLLA